MTIYQILTMANLLRAIIMWQSRDLGVCILCHRDVFPNFVMLVMAMTTFGLIAQFEGKLSISYVLLDSCDSLREYFEYDATIARCTSSDHVYTTWCYTHNHANVEFTPVSNKTTGSNYVNSSCACPTCACRRKKRTQDILLPVFAEFVLFSHVCWLESCSPIPWIVAGTVTTTSTAARLLSYCFWRRDVALVQLKIPFVTWIRTMSNAMNYSLNLIQEFTFCWHMAYIAICKKDWYWLGLC